MIKMQVWRLKVENGVHIATVNTHKHGVWGILKAAQMKGIICATEVTFLRASWSRNIL